MGSRWRGTQRRRVRRPRRRSASTRTRTSRRSRAARWSSTTSARRARVEALRFHGITLPRRPHARRRVSRRQVQPARRQRAHRRARSCAQLPEFLAHAPRARRALLRALSRPIPTCVLPPRPRRRDDGQSWNMFSVLLPLDRLAHRRGAQFRDALEARGIGTGVSYEALHLSHARPALRRSRRPVSERRAHRARDGDAAAACGDDRGRRRPRVRRGRRSHRVARVECRR